MTHWHSADDVQNLLSALNEFGEATKLLVIQKDFEIEIMVSVPELPAPFTGWRPFFP